jgi:hypothetical protein
LSPSVEEAHGQTAAASDLAPGARKARPTSRELKEIARREAPVLVRELIRLATKAESEAVRVAAIKEMFDRGFGKATQPVEGSLSISEPLAELFKENAGNTLGQEIARRAALPPPNGQKPY